MMALALLLGTVMAAQKAPEISVSAERVRAGESFFVSRKGFTPGNAVISHLKKPDETEYHPLRIQTNDRGEFVHRIDSTMLESGVYELWIEDEAARAVSNHIRFTVDP